jgi:hypothetical protein
MAETGWSEESPGPVGGGGGTDETADRTAMIAGRLKEIYKKSVYPVEKKYQYDYFYESPLMTDVEFDGECFISGVADEFEQRLPYAVQISHSGS